MSQRICSIVDCLRPHSSRGWCARHYDSWKRLGDPLAAKVYEKRLDRCGVTACDSPVLARGYCDSHYKLVRKYGQPTPRLRGQVVDGKRICAGCGLDVPVEEYGTGASYCRACCTRRTQSYYVPRPTFATPCKVCGTSFEADKRRKAYCSPGCSKVGNEITQRAHVQRYRAAKRVATTELFRDVEIFIRDGWVCQICDEPIDQSAKSPHPLSASLDHIIPLSRGGGHSRANTQAAHLSCNCRKGASLPN